MRPDVHAGPAAVGRRPSIWQYLSGAGIGPSAGPMCSGSRQTSGGPLGAARKSGDFRYLTLQQERDFTLIDENEGSYSRRWLGGIPWSFLEEKDDASDDLGDVL